MADERQAQLDVLQTAIRGCTRCVERGYIPAAHPVLLGRSDHRNMIVGQAPGARSLANGVPWTGPSGVLLRSWFARAGFNPDRFLESWYFTSLTKCFPGKAKSGPGDRAPSAAERALCRSHLDGELALVQPRLVVTLGRLAADTLIPVARSLALRDLVGREYHVDLGYGLVPVLPLPHPSGVGRWLNDAANRALVDRALERLAMLREGRTDSARLDS